ncbi:hypothetical protein CSUB01_12419 [Colletotrichum sublineola]|uniref:Uncharacterized protein n=1 Tax=Colletotrichum sublineola TaxID=1173701 RepID=A0A066X632_COLSU|nr:hypothetical protein CSUB01_12419 [Colletotrichum sublineola]
MRLVNASTLELCDFTFTRVPPYMILSHTWGQDEVTFQDMASSVRHNKKGYVKIKETCRLALENNLEYIWVDTCCIDKSSSAELTESINSMFLYYANATICIVYLVDLLSGKALGASKCRWFTRGWTLQELVAPRTHAFYDQTWTCIGSKSSLVEELSSLTKVPRAVLSRERPLSDFSVASRMSWAAHRQTTRLEDMAYCLLGIFDVHIPLIYGEGCKAFRRLQLEIMKRNNDLTILAWKEPESRGTETHKSPYMGLLAQSPQDFSTSGKISPFSSDYPEFSATNKGLVISPDIPLRIFQVRDSELQQSAMLLGWDRSTGNHGGILLKKVGPGIFYRKKQESWVGFDLRGRQIHLPKNETSFCIMIDPDERSIAQVQWFREHAISVSHENGFRVHRVVPERLWDPEDQIFLRPKPYRGVFFPVVVGIWFKVAATGASHASSFIVLCDNQDGIPGIAVIRDKTGITQLQDTMFSAKHVEESISFYEMNEAFPGIRWMRPEAGSVDSKPGHRIHVSRQDSPTELVKVQLLRTSKHGEKRFLDENEVLLEDRASM